MCGKYGPNGYTFHSEEGRPIVNPARFPDFQNMTNYAHSLGLTAGWYGSASGRAASRGHARGRLTRAPHLNPLALRLSFSSFLFPLDNCICSDHCSTPECYQGDVDATLDYGFDSIKLDGCGAQRDLDKYSSLFNATGKAILIENCHWG